MHPRTHQIDVCGFPLAFTAACMACMMLAVSAEACFPEEPVAELQAPF